MNPGEEPRSIDLRRSMQTLHGLRFRVLPRWREPLDEIGIRADRGWVELSPGTLASRSPSTRCFRVTLRGGEVVYFKRYVYPPRKWLEFFLRPGKAAVETFGYACLQELGIPSLEVIAFGELRTLGMLRAAFLVTREIEDSRDLAAFAREVWYPLAADQRSRLYAEIAQQLAEQLRRAHAARFFHHDLKWRNLLIQRVAGRYTPVWIDCPRADVKRLRWRRGVIVDLSALARLALSYLNPRERYRFLRRYLGPGAPRGQAKQLFRKVEAHLARRPPRKLDLPPRA